MAEAVAAVRYEPVLELDKAVAWSRTDFTPPLRFGFREDPVPAWAQQPDATRILFLGDSFTFGYGVDDGSARFTDLVESRLNAEAEDGRRFHVFNAGVSATYPSHWIGYLRDMIHGYRPQHVVVVFFLRDGTLLETSMRFHQKKIESIRAEQPAHALYPYSYLARTLIDRQVLSEFTDWYMGEFDRGYLGDDEETSTWRDMQEILERMNRVCRNNGIDMQMLLFPVLFDLDDYRFVAVEEEIEAFCQRSGIPVSSLTPGFLGRKARDLWVAPYDQHPNELGHAIAAETMFPHLTQVLGSCQACAERNGQGSHHVGGEPTTDGPEEE